MTVRRVLTALLLGLSLAACGAKGDLVLPESEPPPAAPADKPGQ